MNFHGGDIYSCDQEVLDFSSNINPLGIPVSFKKALREHMDDFTRYPDMQYRKLRLALAEYLDFDFPELVIPGNGAVELIFKTISALGPEKMINLSPTFSEYVRAARQYGAEIIDLPAYKTDFMGLNFDLVFNHLDFGSLVVICNPNNPTGTLVSKQMMCQVAEELAKKDCFLIIDEAFIEFTDGYPGNSMVGELKNHPNILIIRAATKFFGMPGIRLGFGVTGNSWLVKKIAHGLEPWNVNAAAVLAGCTVYRDWEYIKASRQWAALERRYLFECLSRIKSVQVYPSEANFHLVRLRHEKLDVWALKELMLKKGILIRTPDGFNYLTSQHFRLAVKDRKANEKMINVLREVLSLDEE